MLGSGNPARLLHVAMTKDHAVGFHRAGRKRHHPDAIRRVIRRHRLGELNQRPLGRAIGGATGRAHMAELGRHVDDRAAAAGDHHRQHAARLIR